MLGFLRGKSGELRVGYQVAARLGDWSARRAATRECFSLDAEAVSTDAYWISKTPAVAHLWMGAHRWVFDVESVSNSGDRITAQLRPVKK